MSKLVALTILAFSLSCSESAAFDIAEYHRRTQAPTLESFIAGFPFAEYLKTVRFDDVEELQRHRYFLYQQYGDGDLFLFHLGDYFLTAFPIRGSIGDLQAKTSIGERYLGRYAAMHPGTREIYGVMGLYILGRVAKAAEDALKAGTFKADDPGVADLLARLEKHQVIVALEESTKNKIINNLKQGNVKYVVSRGRAKANEHRWLLLVIVSALGGLFAVVVWRHPARWARRGLIVMSTVFILVLVGAFYPEDTRSRASIANPWRLSAVRSAHGALNVFALTDTRKGRQVGHAIWLSRPGLKAHYLAHGNVPNRYHAETQRRLVVLATTGGFTNKSRVPDGFTIERGNVVNGLLLHDRHGLVVVIDGAIHVFDLRKADLTLPGGVTIRNPLQNLRGYAQLLRWCRANSATIFQTQLLAFSDQPIQRSKPELRERRLLALVSDRQSGEVHHVIFNVREQYSLVDLATTVSAMFQQRKKKIEAILNLDTGAFNILEVRGDNGDLMPDLLGPTPSSTATNLLFYTR